MGRSSSLLHGTTYILTIDLGSGSVIAVEVLQKPPKDWNTWLSTWEEAMSEGIEKGLLETSRVNAWFDAFIKAVQIVVPEWATAYEMMKANDKTLSYRTLANDFRMQIVSRAKGGKG